jgi:hypothetical protein
MDEVREDDGKDTGRMHLTRHVSLQRTCANSVCSIKLERVCEIKENDGGGGVFSTSTNGRVVVREIRTIVDVLDSKIQAINSQGDDENTKKVQNLRDNSDGHL